MQFKCPKCDKVIDLTLEELALSKKIVVCPQCLNEFLAQGVDIPASMLRSTATVKASRQLYCHSCGESLPVAGLKFCPYCGADQNLAPKAMAAEAAKESSSQSPQSASTQAMGDSNLKINEDKAVVEDDASDMMSSLPFIRPLPRIRTRREVMGGPITRFVCYIIIVLLIALFVFVIYLTYFDNNGEVARSIGLDF